MQYVQTETAYLAKCAELHLIPFSLAFQIAEEFDFDPYLLNVAYRKKTILEQLQGQTSGLVW